ncbi:fimbria/pilus periplasmic chaperone [uncultured Leclercia sp.]|uniref:fimbrial biogenesis chaperone n=1 Tax=uncultured Leclercia sp. TaxID=332959 RepID=UPI00259ACFD8|nr:fimbria/pilus periplasmic chaperone [uncultured Leclercia sp.]
MKKIHTSCCSFFAGLLLMLSGSSVAYASIVIDGTRVIYPSDAREITVKLTNNGKRPVLVQSWLDTGNPDDVPDKITTPFILTPPVNRVDAGKGQTLRINGASTSALRRDRETVYWLNVLEIPMRPQQAETKVNYLQLAVRTRIKLFYRPTGLQGDANDAPSTLTWRARDNNVVVSNPSPFYVSLTQINTNGRTVPADMVSPGGELTLNANVARGSTITAFWVNDYGAIKSKDFTVN